MEFNLLKAIDILERTPMVLDKLLYEISNDWALCNEGEDTFSPYDVLGHLIHGEKTDWVVRMEIILSDTSDKVFQPYDRFAQFTESKGKTLNQLVTEFKQLRIENVTLLKSKSLTEIELIKTAIHPALGTVALKQLLATWVVHDLSHLAQIARVMAKQYKDEVGPWISYSSLLNK